MRKGRTPPSVNYQCPVPQLPDGLLKELDRRFMIQGRDVIYATICGMGQRPIKAGTHFGGVLGGINSKYRVGSVTFEGKKYKIKAHDIAYYLHYRRWPEEIVSHFDGDGLNNDPPNLRQGKNIVFAKRKVFKIKGVQFCNENKLYGASIKVFDRTYHLGYFNLAYDACVVRILAEEMIRDFKVEIAKRGNKSPDTQQPFHIPRSETEISMQGITTS